MVQGRDRAEKQQAHLHPGGQSHKGQHAFEALLAKGSWPRIGRSKGTEQWPSTDANAASHKDAQVVQRPMLATEVSYLGEGQANLKGDKRFVEVSGFHANRVARNLKIMPNSTWPMKINEEPTPDLKSPAQSHEGSRDRHPSETSISEKGAGCKGSSRDDLQHHCSRVHGRGFPPELWRNLMDLMGGNSVLIQPA